MRAAEGTDIEQASCRPVARRPLPRAILAGCLAGIVLALGAEVGHVLFGSNLHEVIPGRVFRCSQPSGAELERLIEKHGIQTVVNLRGPCPHHPWYIAEARATHRSGVVQEDIGLSATRLPSVHELRRLVEVLDGSAQPILMHCRRGADRTGVASAVAQLLHGDVELAQARSQLGPRYGHVPLGKTARLSSFFDLYEEWLDREGCEHAPAVFRRWAREGYCPGECRCRLELREPLTSVPAGEPFIIAVRAHNTSVRPWRLKPGTLAGIHLVANLYNAQERSFGVWRAGRFDAVVAPGESIDLTLALPPLWPGRYRLLVDMMDEQHCSFFQAGSEPLEQELEVRGEETPPGGRPGPAGLASLANRLAPAH